MSLTWKSESRFFPGVTTIAPRIDWLLGPARKNFFANVLQRNQKLPDDELPIRVTVTVSLSRLRQRTDSTRGFLRELSNDWPVFVERILEIDEKSLLVDDVDQNNTGEKIAQIDPNVVNQSRSSDDSIADLLNLPTQRFRPEPSDLDAFTSNVNQGFLRQIGEIASDPSSFIVDISIASETANQLDAEEYRYDPFKTAPPPALGKESDSADSADAADEGTVVVGVIDDGIAIAHDRFHGSDGKTRIEYAWFQESMQLARDITLSTITPEVVVGDEWSKVDIDNLLASCTVAGQVDEDKFYRLSGLANFTESQRMHKPHAHRVGHGTHVMDLFCGYHAETAPTNRPVVCVQLPRTVTETPANIYRVGDVERAVRYIFQRADKIARDRAIAKGDNPDNAKSLPVVINFSYGNQAGPHDGTLPLELAVDQLVRQRNEQQARTAIVLPSGNNFLARGHARMDFTEQGQVETLVWRVQPDDYTDSFAQIWFPSDAQPDDFEVHVTPPNGPRGTMSRSIVAEGELVESDSDIKLIDSNGNTVAQVIGADMASGPTGSFRPMVEIQLRGTSSYDKVPQVAPAGDWTIEIIRVTEPTVEQGPVAVVEAWIERDDAPVGFVNRGRQSYFNNPCYEVYDYRGRYVEKDSIDCIVKRFGNISAIATGSSPYVVAGISASSQKHARYAAAGPASSEFTSTSDPVQRVPPDLAATGDDSAVHQGVLAAGIRSGSRVALQGTSMAAPQFARRLAQWFSSGGQAERQPILDATLFPSSGGFVDTATASAEQVERQQLMGYGLLLPSVDASDPPGRGRLADLQRRLYVELEDRASS